MSKVRTAAEGRTVPSIQEGEEIAPLEFQVTPEVADFFIVGIDDRHPWYAEDSPFGGRIAPPCLVTMLSLRATAAYLYGEWQPLFEEPALLEYVNEAEHLSPVRVGEHVRVSGRCTSRYERRGRQFMEFEFTLSDQGGRVLSKLHRVSLLAYQRQGA